MTVIVIISASALLILLCIYRFVLQYPELRTDPKTGKWYRITGSDMLCSDGSRYRAFFRKGSENKVIIYFAGGGVSISAATAKEELFVRRLPPFDAVANKFMNNGGIASPVAANPFKDWTVIVLSYATGDFHSGTNDLEYTDKDGNKKILRHHGYTNYSAVMRKSMELGCISGTEAVLVTGFSAGAGAAALLANDAFTNYFPNAKSRTVLVDSMLLLLDDWHSISADVWKSPPEISDRLTTDNLVLDSLTALREDFGDEVTILFACSVRDIELARAQNLYDNGTPEVNEAAGDRFQQILKENIPHFKEIGAYLYIWGDTGWYDVPGELTMHTIISTSDVFTDNEMPGISAAEWTYDAVNGVTRDLGLELADKVYKKE